MFWRERSKLFQWGQSAELCQISWRTQSDEDWPFLILLSSFLTSRPSFLIWLAQKGACFIWEICVCVSMCMSTFSSLPSLCLSTWNCVTTETLTLDKASSMDPRSPFLLFYKNMLVILISNSPEFYVGLLASLLPPWIRWKFYYVCLFLHTNWLCKS